MFKEEKLKKLSKLCFYYYILPWFPHAPFYITSTPYFVHHCELEKQTKRSLYSNKKLNHKSSLRYSETSRQKSKHV